MSFQDSANEFKRRLNLVHQLLKSNNSEESVSDIGYIINLIRARFYKEHEEILNETFHPYFSPDDADNIWIFEDSKCLMKSSDNMFRVYEISDYNEESRTLYFEPKPLMAEAFRYPEYFMIYYILSNQIAD